MKIKRKDKEVEPCVLCGEPTSRKINFHQNQKKQYDKFVCKKCRPHICG